MPGVVLQGVGATRACQPGACGGDTIFRKMITELRGADLIVFELIKSVIFVI